MLRLRLVLTLAVLSIGASNASAALITDTYDWDLGGTGFQTFTDTSLIQWSQTLTFTPNAVSISQIELDLRHSGNKANSSNGTPTQGNGEVWILTSQGGTLIGNLAASWSASAGDFWVLQTFSIPTSLWPATPATSWTLALRLTETTNNSCCAPDQISLDYSTLRATYTPGTVPPTNLPAVPEPASILLLGTGLGAVAARVRRARRKG